jgi:hypothetical protein
LKPTWTNDGQSTADYFNSSWSIEARWSQQRPGQVISIPPGPIEALGNPAPAWYLLTFQFLPGRLKHLTSCNGCQHDTFQFLLVGGLKITTRQLCSG